MKLLLCISCQDIFSLPFNLKERVCQCGKVKGKYIDQLNAEYSGESAIPLGFTNSSLVVAVGNQPKEGMGREFIAFVIPQSCDTFRRNDESV